MTAINKKSVKMNFKALYSYIINTNYRSFSGVLGIMISVVSLAVLILRWSNLGTAQKTLFFLMGITFTVINPSMLAWKAFRQLKLSPSYRNTLDYTFMDDGILIEQGEISQKIGWDMVCRMMLTGSMLAIYTSRMHAFVIPVEALGDDRGKILTGIVQFSADYNPMLSKNLREYKSGKGYKAE